MKREIFYDDYAKKLDGQYKEAYDTMHIYIEAIISPGEDLSMLMNEVVDLLLSAQEDQRSVESIIGDDMKSFCEQLTQSQTHSPLEKFFRLLDFYRYLCIIAFVFEGISLISDISDNINNPLSQNTQTGLVFISMTISFGIYSLFKLFTRYAVFHTKWYNKKIDTVFSITIGIIIFLIIVFLPEQTNSLIVIPRYIFLPVTLLIFIFTTIRKKKQKQQDIQEYNYFSLDEVAYNTHIEEFRKKYNKYCMKCQKKNEIPNDVNTWYEERYQKDLRGDVYGKIGFVVIVCVAIIGTMMTSDFIDGIVFTIILLCFEIPIYKFLDKSRIARIKLYQTINERQTDIFDDTLLLDIDV